MDSSASSQRVEIMTARGPMTMSLEEFQTLVGHYRQQLLAKQKRIQEVNDRWTSHYHEGNDHKSSALSQRRVTFNRQSEANSQQQDIQKEHGEGDLSSALQFTVPPAWLDQSDEETDVSGRSGPGELSPSDAGQTNLPSGMVHGNSKPGQESARQVFETYDDMTSHASITPTDIPDDCVMIAYAPQVDPSAGRISTKFEEEPCQTVPIRLPLDETCSNNSGNYCQSQLSSSVRTTGIRA